MTRFKTLLLTALLLTLPALSFAHECKNSLRDLHGGYAYEFSGEFGPESLSNTMSEIGRFRADGKGHLSAFGNTIVNGQSAGSVTYEGTYIVNNDIAYVTVLRVSQSGQLTLNFQLAIGDDTGTVFIQAQPLPLSDFAFTNIHGQGKK